MSEMNTSNSNAAQTVAAVHPDDTPSRHPGKLRVASDQKRFLFAPYNVKVVLGLDDGDDDDDDEEPFNITCITPDKIIAPIFVQNTPEDTVRARSCSQNQIPSTHHSRGSSFEKTPRLEHHEPATDFPMYNMLTGCSPVPANAPACAPSGISRSAGYTAASNAAHCFSMTPGSIQFAMVRFKFTEEVYYVPEEERRDIAIGDLVVVEGDRGENVGVVSLDMTASHRVHDPVHGKVLRRGLNRDRKKYYQSRRRETIATTYCQERVAEFQLQMCVLDTEFQTDGNKLTIYYRRTCSSPVDFRQLQRAVYKHYRCRVWLLNWDSYAAKREQPQEQN